MAGKGENISYIKGKLTWRMRAAAGTESVSMFLFVLSELWRSFDNEQGRKWDTLGLHNLGTYCKRGSRAETWDNYCLQLPVARKTHQLIGDKTEAETESVFYIRHKQITSNRDSNYEWSNRLSHLGSLYIVLTKGTVVSMRINYVEKLRKRQLKGNKCLWLAFCMWHGIPCFHSQNNVGAQLLFLLELEFSAAWYGQIPITMRAPIQHSDAILKMRREGKKKLWSFPVAGEQSECSRLGKEEK